MPSWIRSIPCILALAISLASSGCQAVLSELKDQAAAKPARPESKIGDVKAPPTAKARVANIKLTSLPLKLPLAAEPIPLKAIVTLSDGKENEEVSWESDNPAVARVEGQQLFLLQEGSVKLSASALADPTVQQSLHLTVVKAGSASSQPAAGPGPLPTPAPAATLKPAFEGLKSAPVIAQDGRLQVRLFQDFSYRSEGFPFGLFAGQTDPKLSNAPLELLSKEPNYHASSVKYGVLRLGNSDDNQISFALDINANGFRILYIDLNNNENLTDDAAIQARTSSPDFATKVFLKVPMVDADGQTVLRSYMLWFFLDVEGNGPYIYALHHYSGLVSINGEQYKAIVYEQHNHDALYKESGLWIDLDRNSQLDEKTEHFQDGQTIPAPGEIVTLELLYP